MLEETVIQIIRDEFKMLRDDFQGFREVHRTDHRIITDRIHQTTLDQNTTDGRVTSIEGDIKWLRKIWTGISGGIGGITGYLSGLFTGD